MPRNIMMSKFNQSNGQKFSGYLNPRLFIWYGMFFFSLMFLPINSQGLDMTLGDEQFINVGGKMFGFKYPQGWLIRERELESIDGDKVNRTTIYDRAEDLSSTLTRHMRVYEGEAVAYITHIPKAALVKGGLSSDDIVNYYIHRRGLSLLKYTIVSAEKKKLGEYDLYEIKSRYIDNKNWHENVAAFLFYERHKAVYLEADYLSANRSRFEELLTKAVESIRIAN